MVHEGGGESVTRADSVGNFDGKSWVLMVRLGSDQCAARRAASDANKTNSKFAAEPTGGENVGTFGALERTSQEIQESRKFLVIELENRCTARGITKEIAAEIRLAKVDIKDADREGRERREKSADGGTRNGIALSKRAETNGVSGAASEIQSSENSRKSQATFSEM